MLVINQDSEVVQQNNRGSWISSLASISLSTSMGAALKGRHGAFVGFMSSVIDELLITYNVYHKHYFSSSMFWATTALPPVASYLDRILPNYKPLSYFCSFASASVIAANTDDFLDYRSKIETPLGAFLTISKLFDQNNIISQNEFTKIYSMAFREPTEAIDVIAHDLREIYNNKFLWTYLKSTALSLAGVVLDNAFLYYLSNYSGNLFVTTLINNYNTGELSRLVAVPENLLKKGLQITSVFGLKNLLGYFLQTTQFSLSAQQLQMILERGTKVILEDGNGRKIIDDVNGKEIINNLTNDLFSLYYFGAIKLNEVFSKSLGFLISLHNLQKFAPDCFALYTLSLIPTQVLLRAIAAEKKELSLQHAKAQSKVWAVMYDIIGNIEEINMRDGEEFVRFKYNSFLSDETNIAKKTEYISRFMDAIAQFEAILNKLIDVVYFGSKITANQIDIAKVPLIKTSIDDLNHFLSGNLIFKIVNNELLVSKQRIDNLLEIIAIAKISGVNRVWSDQNGIKFTNYSLSLDGKNLVKIEDFTFQQGSIYAITGKSGCGKTSTLTDIKLWVSSALSSSGEISIGLNNGQKPKIMFLDQKLYLPQESTLLESIFFPNTLAAFNDVEVAQIKEKVVELLKELEIDEFINEQGNNGVISRLDVTEFKLSGGQSKKIAIIQAILNRPDILIMDETFAGLDKRSILLVEQALKKYLSGSMILSVDHHAEDNNYDAFYQYEAHFADGLVLLRSIGSKAVDSLLLQPNLNGFEEVMVTVNG